MKTVNHRFSFLVVLLCCISIHLVATPNPKPLSFDDQIEQLEQKTLQLFESDFIEGTTGKKPNVFQQFVNNRIQKRVKRKFKKLKKRIDKYNADCDLIVLANGDEIEAKIVEVSSQEVKYKKCSFADGPTIVLSKSEIFMIKYRDGTKEMITNNNTNALTNSMGATDTEGERDTGLYIAGLLSGLILYLLGGLIGLFFKKGPKRKSFYDGYWIGLSIATVIVVIASL